MCFAALTCSYRCIACIGAWWTMAPAHKRVRLETVYGMTAVQHVRAALVGPAFPTKAHSGAYLKGLRLCGWSRSASHMTQTASRSGTGREGTSAWPVSSLRSRQIGFRHKCLDGPAVPVRMLTASQLACRSTLGTHGPVMSCGDWPHDMGEVTGILMGMRIQISSRKVLWCMSHRMCPGLRQASEPLRPYLNLQPVMLQTTD